MWYIDIGFSEHMEGDKYKFMSFNEINKEKNVRLKNNSPTAIKGKGTVLLKEKVKTRNVLFITGLKHDLLSVNQICDQGHEVVFISRNCVVRNLDTGEIIIKGMRSPGCVYVSKGGLEHFYLRR